MANRQQFWVTLCLESEVRGHIETLGLPPEELCEVTTTANALLAAFHATCPDTREAILVHSGAQNTVVVILVGGQGVLASSFATGGDYFTRAIAQEKQCSPEAAESLKRAKNLFHGSDALPGFLPRVDAWLSQLMHQLNDWFESSAGANRKLAGFRIIAGGSALDQPGLLEYLQERSRLPFERWPITGVTPTDHPARGYEVAYGTALQALHRIPQRVSLLPADVRAAWKKRLTRQWIDCGSYALVIVIFLLLAVGTWQKWRTWNHKEALLNQARTSLEQTRDNHLATAKLITQYDNWRPLFARQKMTLDTLRTLALLETSRSNRSFWYVLFADQQTYFTQPLPAPPITAPATNAAAAATNAPAPLFTNFQLTSLTGPATNANPAKPGFIAELCIPEDADAARRTFSQLVSEIKSNALFAKVDSLSRDLRRSLADTNVVLPGRHFALALELAEPDFRHPIPLSTRPGRGAGNAVNRAPSPAANSPTDMFSEFNPESAR